MPLPANDFTRKCREISFLLFDCDGVMTDGGIILGSDGFECKSFSTKDGMGITLWRRAGFQCGCITGRSSEALARRAKELHFEELFQGISNKRQVLDKIKEKYGMESSRFAFVGDDINDLSLLGKVAIFFATADCNSEVRKHADFVLESHGGRGAIREAIDRLLREKGLLEKIIEETIG